MRIAISPLAFERALYTLQKHEKGNIHLGGISALCALGKNHYVRLSFKQVTLFGIKKKRLPSWFLNDCGVEILYYNPSFLPSEIGLQTLKTDENDLLISGTTRALMECLYLAPKKEDIVECYQIMEGLYDLDSKLVQQLLESCTSVKVKRLFLYMAEKASYNWFNELDLKNISLGSGHRYLAKDGVYIPSYQITISRELHECV